MDTGYNYSKNSYINKVPFSTAYSTCAEAMQKWFKSLSMSFGMLEILKIPHIGFLIFAIIIITILATYYLCFGRHYFMNISKSVGEPVLICTIDGKICPLDGTIGPFDGTVPYKYNPPDTDPKNYVPAKLFDQTNPMANTYSFWMNISSQKWGLPKYYDEWKHIMNRGTSDAEKQSPGFWLWPKENNLWCIVNTTNGPEEGEGILLENIKFDKWINVTLVLDNQVMDLYIDGKLERTIVLRHTPISSAKDNLYIANNNGFPGYLAFIQFYSRALTPEQVNSMYKYYELYINNYIDNNSLKSNTDVYKYNKDLKAYADICKDNKLKTDIISLTKDKYKNTDNIYKNTGDIDTKFKNLVGNIGNY